MNERPQAHLSQAHLSQAHLSQAHLIERAAERLRREGMATGAIDGSAASMLGGATHPGVPDPASFAPPPPARNDAGANGLMGSGLAAAAQLGASSTIAARPGVVDLSTLMEAGMIDWSQSRTRVSEEFRVIQGQVLRGAFPGEPNAVAPANGAASTSLGEARQAGNVVMITSARPREGKSFASLNLAASIARQRDRDVLLIDLDSKPGSLGSLLGLDGRPGLLELAGDPRLDPQGVISPTELDHLSLLGFGQSANGAEMVASRQMARVIRDLGRRFAERLVILDAPPCLASSDPAAMAPIVGQVVFVVEAEQTQRPEVESALDLIQSCPNITLLLNKVQLRTRHSFGGYYSLYTED